MSQSKSLPPLPFREWKFLDAQLIWVYEGVPQVANQRSVSNRYFTAWGLLQGEVVLAAGGEEVRISAGDWVLLPPGTSERQFSEDARILSIHFEARWITDQALFELRVPIRFSRSETRGWRELMQPMLATIRKHHPHAYNRLQWEEMDFERYVDLQGNFQRWLARLWGEMQRRGELFFLPQNDDPRSMEIKMRVDAKPLHLPFRLENLAEEFGLSAAQVNRIFFSAFRTTPKQYFERRRLAQVKGALLSSSQQVKEIAFGAGFRHQSEFSSWFKKQTGSSPSEFRKRN
ncbi:AraC family transcriptional regulator [Puniceicoccus vermicola]|uniref:AraC family transcriptional regulator n=1 Tax=Puniceicoccus vermicola TaxID=388746 RepID=A0A7X1B1D0_9BACT|nr:AraC family transcriptional regulator [Puniceicoccus vermicola]MBC2603818.1 AraC family transcriptional regulator [Puniceicoccus vermicola]